jgi:hypothetical protein
MCHTKDLYLACEAAKYPFGPDPLIHIVTRPPEKVRLYLGNRRNCQLEPGLI